MLLKWSLIPSESGRKNHFWIDPSNGLWKYHTMFHEIWKYPTVFLVLFLLSFNLSISLLQWDYYEYLLWSFALSIQVLVSSNPALMVQIKGSHHLTRSSLNGVISPLVKGIILLEISISWKVPLYYIQYAFFFLKLGFIYFENLLWPLISCH